MQNTIKLELTIDQLNIALASMGKMPYEQVFPVINEIQRQANIQIEQQQAEAAAEVPAAPEQKAT